MLFTASIMSWVSGLALIPAGVLLVLSKRIQRLPLSDRDAHRVFYGLLVTITICIAALHLLEQPGYGLFFYAYAGLLAAALTAIAGLHTYRTRSLRNRRTALIVLIYLIVIVFLNIWYVQVINPSVSVDSLYSILAMIGAGLTTAFIWQTVHGHNRWLWLGLGALIAAIGIYDFAYNGLLNTFPAWVLRLLDIVSMFLIPVVLIALAGRVAVYLATAPHSIHWSRWLAGAVAVGLLMLLLVVRIVNLFLLDGFDDWGPITLPAFFTLVALTVTLLLIWTLERHRAPAALAYFAIMAAAIYGLFMAIEQINTNPQETTVARAEQVNQAIRDYYADNSRYPASLYDLIPHYFLTIPNPVLYSDHVWCYEGGSDFYRLGYVYSPVWRAPSNTFTIRVQDSAGVPQTESWECAAQLVEYRDRWGGKVL
jgi:hypothetical protein